MAFINLCRWSAVSAGKGNFVVGAAASGCLLPSAMGVVDGKVYYYVAKLGRQWEYGSGVYTVSTTTLARTTISSYSVNNGDTSPVNFATAPVVDVFPSPSSSLEQGQFATGTVLAFRNSTAPTGWTRDATFTDAAIRIIGSGSPSNGGSLAISSATTGGHALIASELAPHTHPITTNDGTTSPTGGGVVGGTGFSQSPPTFDTGNASGTLLGNAHTHPLALKYVDFIIASKN